MGGGKNDHFRALWEKPWLLIGTLVVKVSARRLTIDFAAHLHITIQCDQVRVLCKFEPLVKSGDFEI